MGNIFGGVEPPRWLQEIAKPVDARETGQELGFALGAGMLALQKDPETGKMKGIQQGIAEARMNTADPQWQLKTKALEADIVDKWANAATGWQAYDMRAKDNATWMDVDINKLRGFQEELKTNPNAIPPVMESNRGMAYLGQIEKQQLAIQQAKLRQENAKISVEAAKRTTAFKNSIAEDTTGMLAARIAGMENGGYTKDASGNVIPSESAIIEVNRWRESKNKASFGTAPSVEAAQTRAQGQLSVEAQKAGSRMDYERLRQQNREELEALKQQGKVDLKKMDLQKVDTKGKALTEVDFIKSNWSKVYESLVKNSPERTPGELSRAASAVLSAAWDEMQKDVAKKSPAAPTVPQKPTTQPTTKPAQDSADPLGLFK